MHEIQYKSYKESVDHSKVQKECDNISIHNSDSGSPLNRSIRWVNHTSDSYEEAIDYISSIDSGWYDQIAVKYKMPTKTLTSKALTTLQERRRKKCEQADAYVKKHSVSELKAEFIGCPYCGSKLKKALLHGNSCPLCRTDLRGKTILDTINKHKDAIADIDSKIKAEEKSILAKTATETRWLVKIEYHT